MSIAVQSCPADISVRRLAAKASPSDSNRLGQHRAHESRPTLRLVDDFGPMCTALQDLPDARLWLEQVGLALYEAATGARPVTQVMRWLSPDVYDGVVRRTGRSARRGRPTRRPIRLRRVRVDAVSLPGEDAGVVEAAVVLDDHQRVRVMALRLEGFDGRWLVTACEVG